MFGWNGAKAGRVVLMFVSEFIFRYSYESTERFSFAKPLSAYST